MFCEHSFALHRHKILNRIGKMSTLPPLGKISADAHVCEMSFASTLLFFMFQKGRWASPTTRCMWTTQNGQNYSFFSKYLLLVAFSQVRWAMSRNQRFSRTWWCCSGWSVGGFRWWTTFQVLPLLCVVQHHFDHRSFNHNLLNERRRIWQWYLQGVVGKWQKQKLT